LTSREELLSFGSWRIQLDRGENSKLREFPLKGNEARKRVAVKRRGG